MGNGVYKIQDKGHSSADVNSTKNRQSLYKPVSLMHIGYLHITTYFAMVRFPIATESRSHGAQDAAFNACFRIWLSYVPRDHRHESKRLWYSSRITTHTSWLLRSQNGTSMMISSSKPSKSQGILTTVCHNQERHKKMPMAPTTTP